MTDRWRIITGDCLAVMRDMEADSVDAVVCDPPYNLSDGAPKRDRDCLRGVLADVLLPHDAEFDASDGERGDLAIPALGGSPLRADPPGIASPA